MASILGIRPLARYKDRIVRLEWGEVNIVYETPRFGVIEKPIMDKPRGGWTLFLATMLKNAPPSVLEWVLWREAFLSFLVPRIRQIPEAADLGLYAGLKYGIPKQQDREELQHMWTQISPAKFYPHYYYNPVVGFPHFDNVIDNQFLPEVIKWLHSSLILRKGPISSAAYTAALERWMLETHVPLTSRELNVLAYLSTNLTKTQTQFAKQLNMAPSALSQILKKLAEKHLLRLYHFLDLPLIGLERYLLHLGIQKNRAKTSILNSFSEFPYTHSIQSPSDQTLLVTFFIPQLQILDFRTWIEDLSNSAGFTINSMNRVTDLLISNNFQNYVADIGWSEDFSPILENMKHILLEEITETTRGHTSSYSYHIAEQNTKFPIKLRQEDFTYFRKSTEVILATDRITSRLSSEIRHLGLPKSEHMRYRRRVKKLDKLRIIYPIGFSLIHTNLNTNIRLFILQNHDVVTKIHHAFRLLPFVIGRMDVEGNAIFHIYLPNHLAVDVLSSLKKIIAATKAEFLLSAQPAWKTYLYQPTPITPNNYDFRFGNWIWPENFPKFSSE